MHIEVHSLASGSSGNAVLIRADGRGLLIDAGLSARTLGAALHARGIAPHALDGILLTHEHDDHFRGASRLSARMHCAVVANRATLQAADTRTELGLVKELPTGGEIALGPFRARSFCISHDAAEPVGYVVEVGGVKVAYATDCGCPCAPLREALRGADLCILESNHDREWLRRGPYPPHMKARVASDLGHLSNEDAAGLIAERLEENGPATVWLAHLSAVNNSPSFARRYMLAELSARTLVPCVLEIALRDRPSVVWTPGRVPVQPSLF